MPEKKKFLIWPHDRVGDIVLQAALWGFIGAKIFHNLENLNDFAKDPWGSIIAFSGLTFYGGLIVATIVIIIYIKKFKISVIHFADAMAPTMLSAYAAGRIGCHMSGAIVTGKQHHGLESHPIGHCIQSGQLDGKSKQDASGS